MNPTDTLSARLAASGRGPAYYVSSTPWNLLGATHWVDGLHFLCAADFCDGLLGRSAWPASLAPEDHDSIERMNARILGDADVLAYVTKHGPGGAMFLMFDPANEAAVRAAGLSLWLPPASMRDRVDDKIATTRLGNEAGVRSVPNVLGRVDGYATLRAIAASLGPDLVVQLPFGDSGRTTFFISSEGDYARYASQIEAAPEVKVMRRIRCRPSAIEACVTRHGTVVGPLATELIGFPELTPYRGGWCGNEVAPGAFPTGVVDEAAEVTRRFGERLGSIGYRGVFGLDFLIDEDSGDVYLGELNPRVTGLTPISTQAARDLGLPPLILLHLLEWCDVAHELDVASLSARFQKPARAWGQLIIKETHDAPPVERAPRSGIWGTDASSGRVDFARASLDTGDIHGEDEALVCRIVNVGFERPRGTIIARLLSPARMMTPGYELAPRARAWISAVRERFGSCESGAERP